jgi:indole-3-glycerol phosphate synthase
VLDRIVAVKREEVAALAGRRAELKARALAAPAARGFAASLVAGDAVRVIAEMKRRSPSAGWIREGADAAAMAAAYEAAGAAALSVLTDASFFGGTLADLAAVRARVSLPLLRKDFVIDEVQVHEARAAGADAVLLIVRILADEALAALLGAAAACGLDVLVEAHDAAELERALAAGARLVGINSRDLATFHTDLAVAHRLAAGVPGDVILVGESGIRDAADVAGLAAAGFDAILVGEHLMRSADPGAALAALAAVPRSTARARGATPAAGPGASGSGPGGA